MAARSSFAEGKGGDMLTAGARGQDLSLQSIARFCRDRRGRAVVHQRDHCGRSAILRLDVEYLRHLSDASAGSAILRGNQQAEHICVAQHLKIFARETPSLVDLVRVGAKRLVRYFFIFGEYGLDVRHGSSVARMSAAIEVKNAWDARQRGCLQTRRKTGRRPPAPSGGHSSKAGGAAHRSSSWNIPHWGICRICTTV